MQIGSQKLKLLDELGIQGQHIQKRKELKESIKEYGIAFQEIIIQVVLI